jgi:leishmanolysin
MGSITRKVMTTPALLDYARKFFACDQLHGVPFENDGGEGSAEGHFDMEFFPTEMMNPQANFPEILSMFTLMFLYDTGWYEVNYHMHGEYTVGERAGCGFFNSAAKLTIPGFCTQERNSKVACSSDYRSDALCRRNSFTGNKHIMNHSNYCPSSALKRRSPYLHQFGSVSRCWEVTQNRNIEQPMCFQSICKNGIPNLIRPSNGQVIPCPQGERVALNAENMIIDCPKRSEHFCKSIMNSCKDDCGANKGYCLKGGKCFQYGLAKERQKIPYNRIPFNQSPGRSRRALYH